MALLDIAAGVRALLAESVEIAASSGAVFAVVGGWSPVLLNPGPIPHPGTRDVDLLFESATTPGALADVLKRFCERDYLVSAKHPFQLLRILDIAGTPLVFNVDVLHPQERDHSADLFVDHLDLPLFQDDDATEPYRMRSIALPGSQFIFDGHTTQFDLEATLPTGLPTRVRIPLMDELGLLITKAPAIGPKRSRDALDIFLAIVQARDINALVKSAQALRERQPPEFAVLLGLTTAASDPDSNLRRALHKSASDYGFSELIARSVDEMIRRLNLMTDYT
jgi:hypothetical protein